jgi:hypothetical protein
MLLIVILNAVLAVLIVSVLVALHTRAILTEHAQHRHLTARDRRHRAHWPEYWPARRPATARATRQPVVSAG